MRISVVQPRTIWKDKYGNFEAISKLLSAIDKTDIVILPEMFQTGFSVIPDDISESPESVTFDWMVSIAEKGGFGICGSYIVKEDNLFYNRWVFVTPDKKSWQYDKRHLFSMAGEEKRFTAGKQRITFTFRGVRILPNICYDLRFPVWSRNRSDYDLIINSSNWPQSRREVWKTLLKARAIENQCYAAGANRIGTDGNGVRYCGDSMIINPRGEIMASANDSEAVVSAEISLLVLEEFRRKFPVGLDADDFTLK